MNRREYYVYIMSSSYGTLYVGITNNLHRRTLEHKKQKMTGFTKKYGINRLVYYEQTLNVATAIAREKEIKGWRRRKKLDLIRSYNPQFSDLFDEFFG